MAYKSIPREWSREKLNEYKAKPMLSQSSRDRLSEFRNKLESSFKSPRALPTWKSFRSEVRAAAPAKVASPRLSHYQDISNFRTSTPSRSGSLLKFKTERLFSGKDSSRSSSPGVVTPRPRALGRRIQDLISLEDLKRANEILEAGEIDHRSLPIGYSEEVSRFSRLVSQKFRRISEFNF